jgi:protein SCO1/2
MRKIAVAVLMLCLLGCVDRQAKVEFVGTDISGSQIGDDLGLTDQDGKVRHLSEFKGKLVVLFFGYTHCPDVCPTTLMELAKAMRMLGPKGREVQVLFVTLDPARDLPGVLKQYVPSFDPSFIGLRGSEKQTQQVARDFRIFYAKQVSGGRSGYSIDHSAGLYIFDKKGRIRVYSNPGQGAKDIAGDLGKLLNE